MKRPRTLILTRRDVANLVGMKEAIKALESVFREHALRRTEMPPKIYLHLDKYSGDFRAMPAYVERPESVALKWVNVHPRNSRFALPAVMAIIILNDPRNGFPLCIMDGTYITGLRTGAAGGIAAKYLARKNSGIVSLIGCGIQARTQLAALNELFKINEVKVWGCKDSCAAVFTREMKYIAIPINIAKNPETCVKGCDIVVTTTPSRKPLVKARWIKEGTHINAIGADAEGKEELEPAILKNAKVVVDSWEQASHSGEINVPVQKGMLSKKDIYAEIGEIVSGRKKGRTNDSEITIFDSTGLAIQDATIAAIAYKKAVKSGIGRHIDIIR